jgi:hypothetical protein
MTSKVRIAAAALGAVALAATAAVAAVGWRSYRQTGSVIPPCVRNLKAVDLNLAGLPFYARFDRGTDGEPGLLDRLGLRGVGATEGDDGAQLHLR